jgi:hypothetical protein
VTRDIGCYRIACLRESDGGGIGLHIGSTRTRMDPPSQMIPFCRINTGCVTGGNWSWMVPFCRTSGSCDGMSNMDNLRGIGVYTDRMLCTCQLHRVRYMWFPLVVDNNTIPYLPLETVY